MRQRIVMRISEALEKLDPKKNYELIQELTTYPHNYWLVEGDIPKSDGTPHLFVMEDTEENNRLLLQHTPIDLK